MRVGHGRARSADGAMKLLCVIDSLGSGGAQRQLVTLALEMRRRGHEVTFFTYAEGSFFADSLSGAGIPVVIYRKDHRFSLKPMWRLRSLLRAGWFDVALSFLTTPNLYLLIAARLLKRRPLCIVSERNCADYMKRNALSWRMSEALYGWSDAVVVNSFHLKEHYQGARCAFGDRVFTVLNGYDLEALAPPHMEPVQEPFRVLCIGNLAPRKRAETVIDALGILKRWHPPLEVDWVGETGEGRGTVAGYFESLKLRLAAQGLTGSWRWLGVRGDVPELLRSHHVLVHAGVEEGLPNVICEALACGRPVIAADVLDHARIVEDGKSGLLFEKDSPESLAQGLRTLLGMNPDSRRRMGTHGRRFAQEHLSVMKYTDGYAEVFSFAMQRAHRQELTQIRPVDKESGPVTNGPSVVSRI